MASSIPYILALVLAVNTASGLKCYSCNSQSSTSCGWGIASFTYDTEECTGNIVVGPKCYKITAKSKDGSEYIARGCTSIPEFGCSALAKTVGWMADATSSNSESISDINCITCDSDKCNSASKIARFTVLGVLLATLAFLF